jgi:hypothetical protein
MARIPALKQLVFVCAHTFTTIHRQPSRQRAVSRNLRIIFIDIFHWFHNNITLGNSVQELPGVSLV